MAKYELDVKNSLRLKWMDWLKGVARRLLKCAVGRRRRPFNLARSFFQLAVCTSNYFSTGRCEGKIKGDLQRAGMGWGS